MLQIDMGFTGAANNHCWVNFRLFLLAAACPAEQDWLDESDAEDRSFAQEQAHIAQQDLKAARAESSRRLKALQDLQRCCDDTCLPIPASAMAAERTAREAAESKASAAQASLARKTQLVADLRKRVRSVNLCRTTTPALTFRSSPQ